jgi:hypothetical protein
MSCSWTRFTTADGSLAAYAAIAAAPAADWKSPSEIEMRPFGRLSAAGRKAQPMRGLPRGRPFLVLVRTVIAGGITVLLAAESYDTLWRLKASDRWRCREEHYGIPSQTVE